MPDYVDVNYAPDIDSNWRNAPGTLTHVNAFAPLQSGALGSVGTANYFSSSTLTGSNHLMAQTFRQISGSVRFLTFRVADIDEYDSAATRTNRGTGYNASTTMWSATAWGNQIIATNYLDAPQSSTSGAFSALSGSPPKARMVASNIDFVGFADVDDGGSNVYSDMVWFSGLRNPSTWTPSAATQANNIRLLQAPGPIRAWVAYGKNFVAFKDNAIIVGEYIGPPYVFAWQMVSSRIGCVGQNAVCELDGKLYFLHTSGFYEFDGRTIRPVGLPVAQSFLSEAAFVSGGVIGEDAPSISGKGLAKTQCAADDIEGVVWFQTSLTSVTPACEVVILYGLDVRSGKWGRHAPGYSAGSASAVINNTNTYLSPLVRTTTADMQAFKADSTGRIWQVWNDTGGTTLRSIKYPYTTTDSTAATITSGVWGDQQDSGKNARIYLRHRKGSSALSSGEVTGTVSGFQDEAGNTTNGTATSTFNTEFVAMDHALDARYKTAAITYAAGKKTILAGLALGEGRTGRR